MNSAKEKSSPAYNDLVNIDGIGESMADTILEFFSEPHNSSILDDLCSVVEVIDYSTPAGDSSPLTGKLIVFTGTLTKMSRSEAKVRAEALGANVASSVSKKTDYLVVGDNPGSKARQAYDFGVKTLTEEQWLTLIGDYTADSDKPALE
jgi:DNA ligase (NAD+)